MADRAISDQLSRNDILQILDQVQKQNLVWTSQDIKSAWKKTHHEKNEGLADLAKEDGNKNMQIGKSIKALAHYNQAIFLAPSSSQTLTLSIANRAVVWMKLDQYEKALSDLEWLIDIGNYPKDSIYKIYQRLGLVYLKLGNSIESVQACRKSYEFLKISKMNNELKRKVVEELNTSIRRAKDLPQVSHLENSIRKPEHFLQKEHETLQGFSHKMDIEFTANKGRHAIANEVIEPGEIICETKSVASIIKFNETLKFCYNCLSHASSPIPCEICSAVAFCSVLCRDQAKDRHVYDCQLSFMDISFANEKWGIDGTTRRFLPLKTLAMKPAQFYVENCKEFAEPLPEKLPVSMIGFESIDVLFNSVTHLDTISNQLEHIFVCVFLYGCLEITGYFNSLLSEGKQFQFVLTCISNNRKYSCL